MRRMISLAAIALFAAIPLFAQGQERPYVLITWKADTYTPPYYEGKALPIASSNIIAAVDLMDGGRIVDLGRETVYWYMNDKFISGGTGLTRIAITAPDGIALNTVRLKATIANYKGGVSKTATIQIVAPEAVIESPSPKQRILSSPLALRGWPYFMNVQGLSEVQMSWTVAGREPSTYSDPGTLSVAIDPAIRNGSRIPVQLSISNPEHTFESAVRSETFTLAR